MTTVTVRRGDTLSEIAQRRGRDLVTGPYSSAHSDMRMSVLLLPLLAACASQRVFVPIDPQFQPHARALPVDVCLLHKPSAPYKVVGTLRVSANPDDGLLEVQQMALAEASRVGCELLVAPQFISARSPRSFVLVHGGEDHSSNASPGAGRGQDNGPAPSDSRTSSGSNGPAREGANSRVIHEFACGVYNREGTET